MLGHQGLSMPQTRTGRIRFLGAPGLTFVLGDKSVEFVRYLRDAGSFYGVDARITFRSIKEHAERLASDARTMKGR